MKEPTKFATEQGDVFHECCERWLLGDTTGRDENGDEVNPFPEGWDSRLNFGQSATVQRLFKAMVEEGVLRRTPGREIEKSFQIEVLDGKRASMIGFVDVWTPFGIEDHKTTKDKRWLLSQQKLRESIQMMSYANAWLSIEDWAKSGMETLELRHNQAVVNPQNPLVRATSVAIHPSDAESFFQEKVVPVVEDMLSCKEDRYNPTDWAEVRGPKVKGACGKYGGCPFAEICGGTETINQYRQRVEGHNAEFEKQQQESKAMSEALIAKLAAKKKARAASGAVSPPAEEKPAEQPVEQEAPPEAPAEETAKTAVPDDAPAKMAVAPWGQADCRACAGSGIGSNGQACLPCSTKAKAMGILSKDFTLSPVEGAIEIKRGDMVISVVPFTAPEVKAEEKSKPAKDEKKADEKKSKAGGRPRSGFTLLYGLPKRHSGKQVDLHQVLQEYGQKLAEEWEKDSYWACDAFKRREALAHKAADIALEIGTALVICSSTQRDMLDLASALEPFARNVYGMA